MVKNSQAAVIPAKGYFLEVVSDDGRSQFNVGETGGVGARLYRDGKVFENSGFDITWTIEGSDSLFFVSKKDPKLQRLTAGMNDDGLHAVRFKSDQPSASPATVRAVIEGHTEATFAWSVRYGGGTQGLTLTPVTLGALDADGISAHQAKAKLTLTGAIPDDTMVQFSLPKDSQAYFTAADNVSPDNKTVAIAVDAQGNSGTVSFVDPKTTGETITLSATYPAKKILADPLAFRFDAPPHSIAIRSENRIAFVDGRQQHNAQAALSESQSTAPVQFNLQLNQSAIFNKGANYVVLPSERTANTAAADAVSPPVNFVDKAIAAPLTKTLTVFARHAKANTRDFRFLPPDWLELTPQSQQVPADGISTVTIKALYILQGKPGKTVTFRLSGNGGHFLATPDVIISEHGQVASASPDTNTGWTPELSFVSGDEQLTVTASADGRAPVKEQFSFSTPTGPQVVANVKSVNVDDTMDISGSLTNAQAGVTIQFELPAETAAKFIASGGVTLSPDQKTAQMKTLSGGETPVVRIASQAGEYFFVTVCSINAKPTSRLMDFAQPRRYYFLDYGPKLYMVAIFVAEGNSFKYIFKYLAFQMRTIPLYANVYILNGKYYIFYGTDSLTYCTDVSSDGINFAYNSSRYSQYNSARWTSHNKQSGKFLEFKTQEGNNAGPVSGLDYFSDADVIGKSVYGARFYKLSNTAADHCVGASDGGSNVYFMLSLSSPKAAHIEMTTFGDEASYDGPHSTRLVSNIPANGCMSCATFSDGSIAFSISDYATLFVIRNGKVEQWPFKAGCKGLIARGKRLYCFVSDYYSEYDWDTKQIIDLKPQGLGPSWEYPGVCGF